MLSAIMFLMKTPFNLTNETGQFLFGQKGLLSLKFKGEKDLTD